MTDHWQFWLVCGLACLGGAFVGVLGALAVWDWWKGKDDLEHNGPD